jgi:transmembrane sensor
MEEQTNIYRLLAKKLAGQATEKELTELDTWIHSHPGNEKEAKEIEKIWHDLPAFSSPGEENALKLLREKIRASHEAKPSGKPFIRKKLRKAAAAAGPVLRVAAVVLFFLTTFSIYNFFTNENDQYKPLRFVEQANASGVRTQFELPDGTIVWLNGDSKIIYSDHFSCELREVYLEGEAAFEVTDECHTPFVVNTGTLYTMAFTSHFNVSAFPSEEEVRVTVDHGEAVVVGHGGKQGDVMPLMKLRIPEPATRPLTKLRIPERQDEQSEIIPMMKLVPVSTRLQEKEAAAFSKENHKLVKIERADMFETFGWKDGILYFNDAPLHEIATKLGRWYGRGVSVQSSPDRKISFSGSFVNEPIDKVTTSIAASTGLSFELGQDQIIITCNTH